MKKLLLIGTMLPLIGGAVYATDLQDSDVQVQGSTHKVTICHATSSETNPYVRIVVDSHAIKGHFDNNGTPLSGHEKDLLLQGQQLCPTEAQPPEDNQTPPESVTPPADESFNANK